MTSLTRPTRFVRLLRRMRWFFAVYLLPRHIATIETENGLLSFDSRDRHLGRTLHVYREFEIDGIEFIRRWLQDKKLLTEEASGCVLDIGGYVGMICIAMARRNIFKKAITFEPYPPSFRLLQLNIAQNQLEGRIAAFNLALSDQNAQMTFELSPKNYGDHRVRVVNDHGAQNEMRRKTTTVEAVRFDDFCNQGRLGVPPSEIKLIWMDIQGHEGRFLSGARQFFRARLHVPVFMEFWPYGLQRAGTSREQFRDIVSDTFTHFYSLENDKCVKRSINEIADYFTRHDGPGGGSHIILIKE